MSIFWFYERAGSALLRLRWCTVWAGPLLFAFGRKTLFPHCAYMYPLLVVPWKRSAWIPSTEATSGKLNSWSDRRLDAHAELVWKPIGRAMRKRVFGHMERRPRTVYASAQSGQGSHFPLTESLDTTEEQMPVCDFAHVWDEFESMHFAYVRRHLFSWRGLYNMSMRN